MGKEQEPEWVKNERVAFTKWRDMNKVCLVYVGKVEYGKLVTFLCMTMWHQLQKAIFEIWTQSIPADFSQSEKADLELNHG